MFLRLAPLLPLFGLALVLNAQGAAARHYFEDSIKPVPADAPPSAPHRVREVLTPAESAQPLDIMVSLRMRNLPELQSIVDSGRIVSAAEMEARYLPSKSDYDRMA